MRNHIKRIVSEVAGGASGWAKRHKKVLGGAGALGTAGALGAEEIAELTRKGLGLGKRIIGVGDAIEKAEAPEDTLVEIRPVSPVTHWQEQIKEN